MKGEIVRLEYYHIHPLVSLILRSLSKAQGDGVVDPTNTTIHLFYLGRIRRWSLQKMYWKPEWYSPLCILDQEFHSMVSWGYHILDLKASLITCSIQFLAISMISKTLLRDPTRRFILAGLFRQSVYKLLDDINSQRNKISPGTQSTIKVVLKVVGAVFRGKIWEILGEEILITFPLVVMELSAIGVLSCLNDFQRNQNPGSNAAHLA